MGNTTQNALAIQFTPRGGTRGDFVFTLPTGDTLRCEWMELVWTAELDVKLLLHAAMVVANVRGNERLTRNLEQLIGNLTWEEVQREKFIGRQTFLPDKSSAP